jgi:hypothetical protein
MTHDQALRNEILRLMLLTNAIVFENLRGDTKGTGQTENAHLALNDESGMIKTSDQEILVCAAICSLTTCHFLLISSPSASLLMVDVRPKQSS